MTDARRRETGTDPADCGPAKKPLAIVLGVTADYAFAAAVVLLALRRFPPAKAFDVVLFHSGIGESDRARLGSILPCRFEPFRLPEGIAERMHPRVLRILSGMSFARYECFRLLAEYGRVIWLDVDIVIRGDLSGLPGRCRGGIGMARERKPLAANFLSPPDGYDMTAEYHNTGVIVMSDALAGLAGRERLALRGDGAPRGPAPDRRPGGAEPLARRARDRAGRHPPRVQPVPARPVRRRGADRPRDRAPEAVGRLRRPGLERRLRPLAGDGGHAVPEGEDRQGALEPREPVVAKPLAAGGPDGRNRPVPLPARGVPAPGGTRLNARAPRHPAGAGGSGSTPPPA
jgi:hypothetical protein